ncbi:MAG: glycosyltransferase family 2 protein [Mycoplasma sp.]
MLKANQMNKTTRSIEKFDIELYSKTLVIVPCYNEEKNICKAIKNLLKIHNFNYLIVNDCSTDNTLNVLKENNFNYITNKENMGLSKTFREGVKWALLNNYKYVVQFDGDGQHNAADIIEMMNQASKGYDIVITSRYYSVHDISKNKIYAHKILSWCFKIRTGELVTDPTCGLRLYNWIAMQEYVDNEKLQVEPSTIAYLVGKKKMKMKETGTTVFARENGESIFEKKAHIVRYMTKQIVFTLFTELLYKKEKNK